MSILITGGTGFLGSQLARALVQEGFKPILFDYKPNYRMVSDITNNIVVYCGDITIWSDIVDVMRKYDVKDVFHLAAILPAAAEENPTLGVQVNLIGTYNLLQAAKVFGVERFIFTSTVATYGPNTPTPVDEDVRQEPRNIYGITKVASELLGLYHHYRFGLDFRALRFPTLSGPGRRGGGAALYPALIIECAALGRGYEVEVDEDTRIPILYYKDAVSALKVLFEAKGVGRRVYNVCGITPTAKEIVDAVKSYIPDAKITFNPKPEIVKIVRSYPTMDCRRFCEELGWSLQYTLDALVKDFIDEVRRNRERYE